MGSDFLAHCNDRPRILTAEGLVCKRAPETCTAHAFETCDNAIADQGIALPGPSTKLINFLRYQLSFHVLKQLPTNLCRSDDCNKERWSGMFSRQKSCLQRAPSTWESCGKVLMSRHPALRNDTTIFAATLPLSDPILPKSSMPDSSVHLKQACNQKL